jgi:hypothetical protein
MIRLVAVPRASKQAIAVCEPSLGTNPKLGEIVVLGQRTMPFSSRGPIAKRGLTHAEFPTRQGKRLEQRY